MADLQKLCRRAATGRAKPGISHAGPRRPRRSQKAPQARPPRRRPSRSALRCLSQGPRRSGLRAAAARPAARPPHGEGTRRLPVSEPQRSRPRLPRLPRLGDASGGDQGTLPEQPKNLLGPALGGEWLPRVMQNCLCLRSKAQPAPPSLRASRGSQTLGSKCSAPAAERGSDTWATRVDSKQRGSLMAPRSGGLTDMRFSLGTSRLSLSFSQLALLIGPWASAR